MSDAPEGNPRLCKFCGELPLFQPCLGGRKYHQECAKEVQQHTQAARTFFSRHDISRRKILKFGIVAAGAVLLPSFLPFPRGDSAPGELFDTGTTNVDPWQQIASLRRRLANDEVEAVRAEARRLLAEIGGEQAAESPNPDTRRLWSACEELMHECGASGESNQTFQKLRRGAERVEKYYLKDGDVRRACVAEIFLANLYRVRAGLYQPGTPENRRSIGWAVGYLERADYGLNTLLKGVDDKITIRARHHVASFLSYTSPNLPEAVVRKHLTEVKTLACDLGNPYITLETLEDTANGFSRLYATAPQWQQTEFRSIAEAAIEQARTEFDKFHTPLVGPTVRLLRAETELRLQIWRKERNSVWRDQAQKSFEELVEVWRKCPRSHYQHAFRSWQKYGLKVDVGDTDVQPWTTASLYTFLLDDDLTQAFAMP